MLPVPERFEYEYRGSDLIYGRGCVERLAEQLAARSLDRALVVTGRHVGANREAMDPVAAGLGDRLVGVFDETTPDKLVETVYDGIDRMARVDADVLLAVGGGSSLDIAKQMSVFAADGRPPSAFREAARAGRLEPPRPMTRRRSSSFR